MASAPQEAPDLFTVDQPVVALESVVPEPPAARDPNQPFSVAAATLAELGQGPSPLGQGSQHAPDQPFHVVTSTPGVNSLTAPSASWAPPPPQAVPTQSVASVSLGDCLTAAYPPFLILLVVVGLVALVEPFFAALALIAAPFFFISRVRFRMARLRQINLVILGGLAMVWFIDYLVSLTTYNTDVMVNTWVMLGCWGLALADVLLQWLGLRSGERPDQG